MVLHCWSHATICSCLDRSHLLEWVRIWFGVMAYADVTQVLFPSPVDRCWFSARVSCHPAPEKASEVERVSMFCFSVSYRRKTLKHLLVSSCFTVNMCTDENVDESTAVYEHLLCLMDVFWTDYHYRFLKQAKVAKIAEKFGDSGRLNNFCTSHIFLLSHSDLSEK